jgi:hypothetical protein
LADVDEVSEDGFPVKLPSGAEFTVLTTGEVRYVEERVQQYNNEYRWSNISDLQDIDRIIQNELFIHRWAGWISKTKDYFGEAVEEQSLRKSINDFSGEIRLLKKQLGIDKASRDRERGEDSIPVYLENLRRRAQEFGINRNKMMDKGLELSMQAISLAQLWKNCTPEEQAEQACTSDDIAQWLYDVFRPEFEKVDAEFRATSQKLWITEQ